MRWARVVAVEMLRSGWILNIGKIRAKCLVDGLTMGSDIKKGQG